jgi:hypothetical protein
VLPRRAPTTHAPWRRSAAHARRAKIAAATSAISPSNNVSRLRRRTARHAPRTADARAATASTVSVASRLGGSAACLVLRGPLASAAAAAESRVRRS